MRTPLMYLYYYTVVGMMSVLMRLSFFKFPCVTYLIVKKTPKKTNFNWLSEASIMSCL